VTADIITVLAVIAGVVWLGLMVVSALRNRGGEEIAHNLRPGIDDQHLETRRLEKSQKVAIVGSAFLAISLPLYFLGESNRQEGFVEDFATESEARGEHLVEEFACFSCHGPLGVGGSASYVEKRSGVTVSWAVPSLDDVGYRYDDAELNFWITFGRGNTPMPAWGLPGGGPMNAEQVSDVVNYLGTIQIPQQEAVDKTPGDIVTQAARLQNADQIVDAAILSQRQILAEIEQAPADSAFITRLSEQAREVLDNAEVGIDTDDDGLSDVAEVELSAISSQAVDYFRVVDAITLDPATPDAEKAGEAVAQLEAAIPSDPILEVHLVAIGGGQQQDHPRRYRGDRTRPDQPGIGRRPAGPADGQLDGGRPRVGFHHDHGDRREPGQTRGPRRGWPPVSTLGTGRGAMGDRDSGSGRIDGGE
jgi:mono/diheme cytochrome c family protein